MSKLNPNIYKEAARRIDELESFSIDHAITFAVYDANTIHNPQDYINAWMDEFQRIPGMPFPGSNLNSVEKVNSLLRMAYLAEKEDE